jgi:hypothetical protein
MRGFKLLCAVLTLVVLALPALAEIKVIGCVQRPGVYKVEGETSIAEALTLAGGILKETDLSNVWIIRPGGSINKVNAERSSSETKLHTGDILFVAEKTGWAAKPGGMAGVARIGETEAPVELDDLISAVKGEIKEMLDLSGSALTASKSLLQEMAPSVTPLLSDLSYVRIRKFTLDDASKLKVFIREMEGKRLKSSGWRKVMMSSPAANMMTALYTLENEKGETVGLLVLNTRDMEVQIVNLVGRIDFAKMGDLITLVRSGRGKTIKPPPPYVRLPSIQVYSGSPSTMRVYGDEQAAKLKKEVEETLKKAMEEARRNRLKALEKSRGMMREALEEVSKDLRETLKRIQRIQEEPKAYAEMRKAIEEVNRRTEETLKRIQEMLKAIESAEKRERIEMLSQQGYLGVRVYDLRSFEVEKFKTSPHKKGAVVSKVYKGSPADRVGIRVNDVIVSFKGHEVRGRGDLVNLVLGSKPGDRAEIELIRKGEKIKVEVEIGERPVE